MVGNVCRYAVIVVNGRGQGFAHFRLARDADGAFVVSRRNRRLRVRIGGVNHRRGRRAGRCLRVLRVVGVGRAHADGFARIICGQLVAAAGCTGDGNTIRQPLVLHVGRDTVGIIDFGGQGLAYFCIT